MELIRAGRLNEAEQELQVMAQAQRSPMIYYNLGLVQTQLGRVDAAITSYCTSIATSTAQTPTLGDVLVNMGVLLEHVTPRLGKDGGSISMPVVRLDSAFRMYVAARRITPRHWLPRLNIGNRIISLAQLCRSCSVVARAELRRAANINPYSAEILSALGSAEVAAGGDVNVALVLQQRALKLNPMYPQALFAVANAHAESSQLGDAVRIYEDAIRSCRRGGSIDAALAAQIYSNMGNCFHSQHKYTEASRAFGHAIALDPQLAVAYVNMGETLRLMDDWEGALEMAVVAADLDATNGVAIANAASYALHIAEWGKAQYFMKRLKKALAGGLVARQPGMSARTPVVSGYQAIMLPFTSMDTLKYLKAAAQVVNNHAQFSPILKAQKFVPVALPTGRQAGAVTRIAVVSGDFGEHTTGINIAGFFIAAGKISDLELHCFGTGEYDGGRTVRMIARSCSTFVNASKLTDLQLASSINNKKVHIVSDMSGYTHGARSVALALQPAQFSIWEQGYAGSSGGLADLFGGDRVSTPPEYARHFTERLLVFPQVSNPLNNHRLGDWEVLFERDGFTKERLGLTELSTGPVTLCAFSTPYKVGSHDVASWASTARQLGAALWMSSPSEAVDSRLIGQAARGGLTPRQLLLTRPFPLSEHLLWKQHCSLVLDASSFSSHGSAHHLYWSALPLVTLPGERLSSRIASSVAISISSASASLVARGYDCIQYPCFEDFKSIVTHSANHVIWRQELRVELMRARLQSIFYDLGLYTCNYRRIVRIAVETMGKMHVVGSECKPSSNVDVRTSHAEVYLSVVLVGRNDDLFVRRGLSRWRVFLQSLYRISAFRIEVLLIELEAPERRDSFVSKLPRPPSPHIMSRVFVPTKTLMESYVVSSFAGARLDFPEYFGKNIGVRRASGTYVLVTNPDVVFNLRLVEWLNTMPLKATEFYRIDRHELADSILDAENVEAATSSVVHVSPWDGTFECNCAINESEHDYLSKRAYREGGPVVTKVKKLQNLHHTAAGDFMLMSKEAWTELRGFPEIPVTHGLDSLLCLNAAALGLNQVYLPLPFKLYHQPHDRAGDARGSTLNPGDLVLIAEVSLRRQRVVVSNDQGWGLGHMDLVAKKV